MPSDALTSLLAGVEEIRNLQAANPTPLGGLPQRPAVVRAINRASVVLLCSHLERYLRSINEEAVQVINASDVSSSSLPDVLRLQYSKSAIDDIFEIQWDRRGQSLEQFIRTDGWLWAAPDKADLDHERLLKWMKSPSPRRAKRLFQLWGVSDIFKKVTRLPHTRQRMWLKLEELVEKRNEIAHGDAGAIATYQDISAYLSVVRQFCERADNALARTMAVFNGGQRPW